ncbi:MBL fold metallo-hydrolase [Mycolicibacterium komossense]|uniref:MBL fold metallo-hydrolase n=1 Tax=Mycolicibacterium komossense TaxID=1779 RepID=A0ABT3CCS7_9MYCO|nr:MBL fold metallo-hydrolase [Mycolicibacterium komossense]MCV7227287.1 MBL fold metallo-hydrolase [Mycolicibacterium komossense]
MKTKIVKIPVLGDHLVNTYLLIGRRPILVDCGMPSSGDRIWNGVTAAGVDPTDLEMIIVTHGHVDHFGAAAELAARTGAPVAAHAADLPTYLAGHSDRAQRQPIGVFGHVFSRTPPPNEVTRPLHPDRVLTGEYRLDGHGIDARIIHTPGHTPGSVSVLLDQGDLIAGDMLTGGFLGLLQYRPSNPPFHDDPQQALDSLQAALDLGPHTLHLGHGGPMEAPRVQRWLDGQLAQPTHSKERASS